MKKKAGPAQAQAEPEDPQKSEKDGKLYLRKAGRKVGGKYPYMCFSADGSKRIIVFSSDRELAKATIWKTFGKTEKFQR